MSNFKRRMVIETGMNMGSTLILCKVLMGNNTEITAVPTARIEGEIVIDALIGPDLNADYMTAYIQGLRHMLVFGQSTLGA